MTAMTRHVSRASARRFLARRHLLAPPRSLPPRADSVMAVVERLGSLQFDPLDVAGRNHDLVLQARIAGYRRELADDLLYGSRRLFETYNKGLNLLPVEELPYYRISWQIGLGGSGGRLVEAYPDLARKILDAIRTEGPKCSLDFERREAIDWWWGPTSAVRAVLEALCVSGTLSLSRRQGSRRYYDLTERLFPRELLARPMPEREQLRHKMLSRHRAHGLLGASGSGELWIGAGTAALRAEFRAEMVDLGELVPVAVEGVRGERFVLGEETAILDEAEREVEDGPRADGPASARGDGPAISFLAPLDPLMWDRALLTPLWGFDYRWEVYTPVGKRRWGYYVLPILFGDRLVGRIEPRLDRRNGTARILGLAFEEGFDPVAEPGFVEAFADALYAYLDFGGGLTLERSGPVTSGPTRTLFRQIGLRPERRSNRVSRVPTDLTRASIIPDTKRS